MRRGGEGEGMEPCTILYIDEQAGKQQAGVFHANTFSM